MVMLNFFYVVMLCCILTSMLFFLLLYAIYVSLPVPIFSELLTCCSSSSIEFQ